MQSASDIGTLLLIIFILLLTWRVVRIHAGDSLKYLGVLLFFLALMVPADQYLIVNNIERILLGNDARTMLQSVDAMNKFNTSATRDAFIALASTDITPDLQNVTGVILKAAYPSQEGLRPEEYCSISRFRIFVSSKAAKIPGASMLGATVYTIPMYGLEAAAKIDQNSYSAILGYRPPYVVSSVAQNSQLYAKFAIARAITNQNWISGLNVTARL